jgi:ubiquinone/menaquinone biosynthesis C-methylase UbiE
MARWIPELRCSLQRRRRPLPAHLGDHLGVIRARLTPRADSNTAFVTLHPRLRRRDTTTARAPPMNNPVRALVQRRFEARRLLAMGGRMAGGRALEVGCGRGVGAEIILDVFGAGRVDAFDLDPDMVERAKRRLERYGDRVRLWTGDAEKISAASASYDAVFDFGIVHHVPRWREALSEIHRVLRPGGTFYAEEVLRAFILHPLWRRVLEHPLEDRFDAGEFRRALETTGFRVRAERELFGHFAWFVAEKSDERDN